LAAVATVGALGWVAAPAGAEPNGLEGALGAVRGTVEGTLQSLPKPELPKPEQPAAPPVAEILPTAVPAPPPPVAPPPAIGGPAASEGSGTVSPPSGQDSGQPVSSPARTHVSTPATAVADAHRSSYRGAPRHSVPKPVGGPPEAARGVPGFAIPAAEPAAGPALVSAAPVPSDGRSQPVALSDWIGSGPPLPPVFVYLAVFAGGLAILVSMRRELGLYPRRRRRF
jgi:hypothetical protein